MSPQYTYGEICADACIHAVGVSGAVVASAILLVIAIPDLPAGSTLSLVIYASALIIMLSMSAAYHLIPAPSWKGTLRRLDQAAIFLKIAGTYTPFVLVKMGGVAGYTLLGTVWGVAIVGALLKLMLTTRWDRVSLFMYLLLGWAGLAVLNPLVVAVPTTALILLGIGGALYTIGVLFHVWETLPFQNAVWHFFVLAGTSCHFAAVVNAVVVN